MVFKVYPYKQGSRSAKELAVALNGKVLKVAGSKYKPRVGNVVVNWGASNVPPLAPATILNKDVTNAQCKLRTLEAFKEKGISAPKFATTRADAEELVFPVVCRTKLRGHSGDGIVIADLPEQLVNAPLYTQYVKKKDEYRVHVFRDEAFFIQRKTRKLENENPDWRVRNLEGGFVFVETGGEAVPDDVVRCAVDAVSSLSLDFGGVDVIWNAKESKAYVLEINTACGLEERTAKKYAEVFNRFAAER